MFQSGRGRSGTAGRVGGGRRSVAASGVTAGAVESGAEVLYIEINSSSSSRGAGGSGSKQVSSSRCGSYSSGIGISCA